MRTVRKVTAHTQIQSEDLVAGLKDREEHRRIGLGAAVRLDIGVVTVEDFFQPVDGQLFGLVDDFTTGVIALTRVAFRIFIGHDVAHGLHHLDGSEVFGSDQFQAVALAFQLFFYEVED